MLASTYVYMGASVYNMYLYASALCVQVHVYVKVYVYTQVHTNE